MDRQTITVSVIVHKPIDQVWEKWTTPEDIMVWNSAQDDWHTPSAVNDLRVGGRFTYRMAARDGSSSFDFGGVYDEVIPNRKIIYTLGDGRRVIIDFEASGSSVKVTETFVAETTFSQEKQRSGWQSILDHFKRYAEAA